MLKLPNVPVIIGPTASGKTALSIKLARLLNAEIISADSRQIFKLMDIGTAKPSKKTLKEIKHHFIDLLYPNQSYSAGQFSIDSLNIIKDLIKNRKKFIIVGGSGLYIKALCNGLFNEEKKESRLEYRKQIESDLEKYGLEHIYEKLKRVDQVSALKYSDKNPRRIIRALEHYYATGRSITHDFVEKKTIQKIFNPVYLCINESRDILYNIINERCDLIWNNGLRDECENLLNLGYSKDINSLNTVGYKEMFLFLENQMNETEYFEKFKQNTRKYAKRQITWNKKIETINYIDKNNLNLIELIDKYEF